MVCWFFFFKHKRAYEVRISYWSSDVCSSDLGRARCRLGRPGSAGEDRAGEAAGWLLSRMGRTVREFASGHRPIVDCGSAGFCRHLRPAFHGPWIGRPRDSGLRSEEHTSELQSLMRISYAVFCLKKKRPDTDLT